MPPADGRDVSRGGLPRFDMIVRRGLCGLVLLSLVCLSEAAGALRRDQRRHVAVAGGVSEFENRRGAIITGHVFTNTESTQANAYLDPSDNGLTGKTGLPRSGIIPVADFAAPPYLRPITGHSLGVL
jgi:hypothetical protein